MNIQLKPIRSKTRVYMVGSHLISFKPWVRASQIVVEDGRNLHSGFEDTFKNHQNMMLEKNNSQKRGPILYWAIKFH